MEQLTLPLQPRLEAELAEYVPGPNAEALAAVGAWAMGGGESYLYLYGPSGSGKTHLLQAACREAAARGRRVVYLALGHPSLTPAALEGLELADLALDGMQRCAGDPAWEIAVFDAYNRARAAGGRLLIAAQVPPAELRIGLADLRSRLGWGPVYRLRPLGEADCSLLLRRSARRRGLSLGEEAVAYIMRRAAREPAALLRLLDEIDRLSLHQRRQPTLELLRRLLGPGLRAAPAASETPPKDLVSIGTAPLPPEEGAPP